MEIEEFGPKMNEAAELMGILSQPVRLRLLCLLLDGEKNVLELARLVELSQPGVSHHLKKLRDCELVETRRDGQTIYYTLAGQKVKTILAALYGLYCK